MLVDDLIQEVRDGVDEDDTADLSDAKILRALNRAQLKLARLAVRKYPALLRREYAETVSTRAVEVPETAYAWTVNEVAVRSSGSTAWLPCVRAQGQDLVPWDTAATSAVPSHWDQQGTQVLLYPTPSNTEVRIRYQLRPPDLVKSQGRITTVGSGQVYLDAVGDELTTSIAQLKAFVNLVDGTTGVVKGTMQVSAVPATIASPLTFKSSGLDRTTVFGLTVDTAIDADVAVDDYVCIANGTCVPVMFSDYADYLTLAAVIELRRAAGEAVTDEKDQLAALEDDLKAMWAGRAGGKRVTRAANHWSARVSQYRRV